MTEVTQARLKELVCYDPETGVFTRRVTVGRCGRFKAGQQMGSPCHKKGYRFIGVDWGRYLAHRLAWLYMTGEWPRGDIDHINHQTDDNRWANLRDVTHSENLQNQCISAANKSGHTGVTWDNRSRKWMAHIKVAGRFKNLRSFVSIKDAVAARQAGELIYHPSKPAPSGAQMTHARTPAPQGSGPIGAED